MAIQIFEKAVEQHGSIASNFATSALELFHDAGFSDVTHETSSDTGLYYDLTSNSGVYGIKKIQIYTYNIPSDISKLFLAKDDSQNCLILYPNTIPSSTTEGEYNFYNTIIANGKTVTADGTPRFSDSNVLNGDILAPVNTSKAKLVQFIHWGGETFEPLYVAANLVNYPANTTVTDGANSFTSLGNLFYIKNV